MQYGNLLKKRAGLKCHGGEESFLIYLIDFEYSCVGPYYFDIANHWCEWAADYFSDKMLDFETRMPTEEQKMTFLEAYFCTQKHQKQWNADEAMRICDDYAVLSHLMWALWGLNFSLNSEAVHASFDYYEYSLIRLGQFNALYNKIVKM